MSLIEHRQALDSLVRFEGPILELEKPWQSLSYDYDGVPVRLTMAHIKHALRRRIDSDITASDLELWADLVEGRAGIEYEDEEQCSDLLFQLSTPEINQPLSTDVCRRILATVPVEGAGHPMLTSLVGIELHQLVEKRPPFID